MARTIIDLHISNTPYEGENLKITHYMTLADYPLRGAVISTSRDGVMNIAFAEIDALFEANVLFVRMYDMYTMDYYDFYRDTEALEFIESLK